MSALITAADEYCRTHACVYGIECAYERAWWRVSLRLTVAPSVLNQTDVSVVLFRWSDQPLDDMAQALAADLNGLAVSDALALLR